MVRILYKAYYGCAGLSLNRQGQFSKEITTLVNSFAFNGVRNANGTYSAAPSWFTQVNEFPLYDTWWILSEPVESNTQYDFSWTASNKDGTQTEYIVRLVMQAECSFPLGCSTPTRDKPLSVLLWLAREGAWCYFPFNGVKSIEVRIPDGKTYTTPDFVLRNTSRKGVYDGELLSTGDIPEIALELLQSLKESIQVYYVENYTTDGEQIYKPVMLLDGDFAKRKTTERRWDVKVKFIYAEERQIQSQ